MKVESCEQTLCLLLYTIVLMAHLQKRTQETILSCEDLSCFVFIVVMMLIAFTVGDFFPVFCAAFADAVCKLSYRVTVG